MVCLMCSNTLRWLLLILLIGGIAGSVSAVQQDEHPVIAADTIGSLAPVTIIDFAMLPPEAGEIVNGRVYISRDGRRLAVINRDSQVVILDDAGTLVDVTDVILTDDDFPATFIDGTFDQTGERFAALHSASDAYYVTIRTVQASTRRVVVRSEDKAVGIWMDGETVLLEVVPSEPDQDPYVVRIATADGELVQSDLDIRPFAPAGESDSIVRIGRLPLPLAVTATDNGRVFRWNLATGLMTGAAQVDSVPIYGATTPDGRYLVWRDPTSEALHLVDFETQQDRVIVELGGVYIPFILLSHQADVVIGVHVNDEPAVNAWDIASGQSYALGLYRQCQRPPDLVSLSNNGTTLVIGCDAGLEIWRVSQVQRSVGGTDG